MEKLTKSPRLNSLLYKMGIFNEYDVIFHLPKRYDDYSLSPTERNLTDKQKVTFLVKIVSLPITNIGSRIKVTSFDVLTVPKKTFFRIYAYNRPYLSKTLKVDSLITLHGIYDKKRNAINLINYINGEAVGDKRIKAIYSLPTEYPNHLYSSLVERSLNNLKGKIYSDIPYHLMNKYRLLNKEDALIKAHFPKTNIDIHNAYRTLKYEEALLFCLKNQIIHQENKSLIKIKKEPIDFTLAKPLVDSLPFKLTNSQIKVCEEIIEDMNQKTLMYRLLQGDVGSGKTIVCFISLFVNRLRGDQGAIMAPTDSLARQHYENAKNIFKPFKMKIALLVGNTPSNEKKQILDDLADGSIDLVIGTHALFSKSVNYSSLGLVIIDEQHRFGVNQRLALSNKGNHADLLMLSATPIPRSLALSVYGSLEVSTLDEYPTKEKNIRTEIIDESSNLIFQKIDDFLLKKKNVYIVAPKIEYEEDSLNSVEQIFARYVLKYGKKVGLLHGKLKTNEKNEVLNDFYNGVKPILVSTTVIEVGIDVKNAGMMVIYDASSFGLATLHQLRGRIGRDGQEALCLLTYSTIDTTELDKLKFVASTNDGFKIAEYDLATRGPGEMTGLKQAGMPDFSYLNILNDFKILECARDDGTQILKNPDDKGNKYVIDKANKLIKIKPIIGG